MAIIATFTEGLTALTVNGLTQWDRGQVLEVHDIALPYIVEVHLGYPGIREASVQTCYVSNGVLRAHISDHLLEQPAPVTAWIYEVSENTGRTIRTIVMPLTPRPRPAPLEDVPPEDFESRYEQAIGAIEAAADDIKAGDVTINNALHAGHADHADYLNGAWTLSATKLPSTNGVYVIRPHAVTPTGLDAVPLGTAVVVWTGASVCIPCIGYGHFDGRSSMMHANGTIGTDGALTIQAITGSGASLYTKQNATFDYIRIATY